jgi:hypothetical protein
MKSHPFENAAVLALPYRLHAMQTHAMLKADDVSAESRAFLTAAWLLSMQLFPIEEALAFAHRRPAELATAMRERWALGYVFGVCAQSLENANVSRHSPSADDTILQMHRLALRETDAYLCAKLSKAALPYPEYAAGMAAGGADVRSILNEQLGAALTHRLRAKLGL